jgi:uncharacterized coiled-coil protein SlyX
MDEKWNYICAKDEKTKMMTKLACESRSKNEKDMKCFGCSGPKGIAGEKDYDKDHNYSERKTCSVCGKRITNGNTSGTCKECRKKAPLIKTKAENVTCDFCGTVQGMSTVSLRFIQGKGNYYICDVCVLDCYNILVNNGIIKDTDAKEKIKDLEERVQFYVETVKQLNKELEQKEKVIKLRESKIEKLEERNDAYEVEVQGLSGDLREKALKINELKKTKPAPKETKTTITIQDIDDKITEQEEAIKVLKMAKQIFLNE